MSLQNDTKSSRFGNSICNISLLPTLYENLGQTSFKTGTPDYAVYENNLLQSKTSCRFVKMIKLQAGDVKKLSYRNDSANWG